MSHPRIAKLSSVGLRKAWTNEAQDFTPWLHETTAAPGDAIGIRLEPNTNGSANPKSKIANPKSAGAYQRRCALTNERTLPALEAAHIRPYSEVQEHDITNGLLMRRDLHALFDRGYITVTPEYKIEVSRRIKEEFENGNDYYRLHGEEIRKPESRIYLPSESNLRWHNEEIFWG